MNIDHITEAIRSDKQNSSYTARGVEPLFTASRQSRIVLIGQAPGARAEESGIPWDDKSGETLREWLGVSDEEFYNPKLIALMPMDFYYPGKANHGDLPPRKGFAETWHPKLLDQMPNVELIVLIGQYAQHHYLGAARKKNLTETVRSHNEYAPKYFPLVHPSPLNFRWQTKNPWFIKEAVPALQTRIRRILG